jgi:hypothetical protein
MLCSPDAYVSKRVGHEDAIAQEAFAHITKANTLYSALIDAGCSVDAVIQHQHDCADILSVANSDARVILATLTDVSRPTDASVSDGTLSVPADVPLIGRAMPSAPSAPSSAAADIEQLFLEVSDAASGTLFSCVTMWSPSTAAYLSVGSIG